MTAACQEWRESRAIEARLEAGGEESQRWEQDQVRSHDVIVDQLAEIEA